MSKLSGSKKTQRFSYNCVFIFQVELGKNLFSLAEIDQILKKAKIMVICFIIGVRMVKLQLRIKKFMEFFNSIVFMKS